MAEKTQKSKKQERPAEKAIAKTAEKNFHRDLQDWLNLYFAGHSKYGLQVEYDFRGKKNSVTLRMIGRPGEFVVRKFEPKKEGEITRKKR